MAEFASQRDRSIKSICDAQGLPIPSRYTPSDYYSISEHGCAIDFFDDDEMDIGGPCQVGPMTLGVCKSSLPLNSFLLEQLAARDIYTAVSRSVISVRWYWVGLFTKSTAGDFPEMSTRDFAKRLPTSTATCAFRRNENSWPKGKLSGKYAMAPSPTMLRGSTNMQMKCSWRAFHENLIRCLHHARMNRSTLCLLNGDRRLSDELQEPSSGGAVSNIFGANHQFITRPSWLTHAEQMEEKKRILNIIKDFGWVKVALKTSLTAHLRIEWQSLMSIDWWRTRKAFWVCPLVASWGK